MNGRMQIRCSGRRIGNHGVWIVLLVLFPDIREVVHVKPIKFWQFHVILVVEGVCSHGVFDRMDELVLAKWVWLGQCVI